MIINEAVKFAEKSLSSVLKNWKSKTLQKPASSFEGDNWLNIVNSS